MKLLWFLILETAVVSTAQPKIAQASSSNYSAAFYSGDSRLKGKGGYGLQSLVVFPFSGTSFTIGLPFAIHDIAHTPDGKVLYTTAWYTEAAKRAKISGAPDRPGIYRFELDSMRMTEIPSNPDVGIFELAVSQRQDKLIASGTLRERGKQTCGLFEIALPRGEVKSVFERPYCGYLESWSYLSLAPDGERVLAARQENGQSILELIDLAQQTVRILARRATGTWSPDGNWIAVINDNGAELLDARTLKAQKRLPGGMTGSWSPDSRYLIGTTSRGCHGYSFTLQAVDVATGERRTIDSSKCEVDRQTIVWVNMGESGTTTPNHW